MVEAERPKPGCRTAKETVTQINELAQQYPDDQIADILNQGGVLTATGRAWNTRRVANVRKNHGILTGCPYFRQSPGPRGDGLIAASEAATRLGVGPSMIAYWFRQGLLIGHQRASRAALWVRLTDDDFQRLNGAAQLCDDLIPIPEAPKMLGLTPEQMRADIRAGELLTYRLRIKNRWRWYVQIPDQSTTLTSEP